MGLWSNHRGDGERTETLLSDLVEAIEVRILDRYVLDH